MKYSLTSTKDPWLFVGIDNEKKYYIRLRKVYAKNMSISGYKDVWRCSVYSLGDIIEWGPSLGPLLTDKLSEIETGSKQECEAWLEYLSMV